MTEPIEYEFRDGYPRITKISAKQKDALLRLGVALMSGLKRGKPSLSITLNGDISTIGGIGSHALSADEAEILSEISHNDRNTIYTLLEELRERFKNENRNGNFFKEWHNQSVSQRWKGMHATGSSVLRSIGNSRGVLLPSNVLSAAGVKPECKFRIETDTENGVIKLIPERAKSAAFEYVPTIDSSLALLVFFHSVAKDVCGRLNSALQVCDQFTPA